MSFKETAVNAISHLLRGLSKKKIILFESVPDFSDNTMAVFREMVNRGYDKRCYLVWELGDRDTGVDAYQPFCKDFILRNYQTLPERLKHFYYTAAASVFVSCNRFIKKQSTDDSQKYMHLAHGCALKKTEHYYVPQSLSNADVLTLSDFFLKYDAINLGVRREQLKVLGYPRCDELFRRSVSLPSLFPAANFQKAIYWLPTYRQHNSGKYTHSNVSFPLIYSEKIALELNHFLEENKVLLIVKPHPAQDLSVITALHLSHLVFIDNRYLQQHNVSNYELLGSCDALISDYSSVYYDYLLCDKPIGLCFDDFEEYNARSGFTVSPEILDGGVKLYQLDDLKAFITSVVNGEDLLKEERARILSVVHKYNDDKATERVVDYMEEHYGLK